MFGQTTINKGTIVSFILLSLVFNNCESARILGFFPTHAKSHLIIHTAIADALAERGHNVTVFQTHPPLKSNLKYTTISIEVPKFETKFFSEIINKGTPIHMNVDRITEQVAKHTNLTFSNPKTQQFLRDYKDSFDLMILGYFLNDYYLGLGAHFNCPVVISFMLQPILGLNQILGNPSEMAYVPTVFSGLKQPLGFIGRVKNFLISIFERVIFATHLAHHMNKRYETLFPANRYPPLEAMYKNVSLVLSNHHFSQGPIRPNVPALIDIGGIQIKDKPSPLPADIAKILDDATEGVIYFSLGTNVQGSHLNKEKTKIMFNVLSKLPHKVLWKWSDTEDYPGESKNIIYKSWLPQDDILAHPNIKLFITHGGQGSVVESQYHGVPMIGIPLFGDQPSNARRIELSGFGLRVDYLTLSEKSLSGAILEVLQNEKYSETVKAFSRIYSDRPMTARQTAVYWVEYVLRHRGAKHLQSPAIHLNFWQLMSLDVIGFLLVILTIIIGGLIVMCKYFISFCCRSRKNYATKTVMKSKSKTKNNKKLQ